MTIEEMKDREIEKYCDFQLIKRDNGGNPNPTLDFKIAESAAKLETFGVNLETLTIAN